MTESKGGVSQDVLVAWFTAACAADDTGSVKTLERLLKENQGSLDVNATGLSGITALGRAAFAGHADVIALLLKHGADVRKYGSNASILPLHVAAGKGHAEAVRALVAGGAKVNEVADKSYELPTALHSAAAKGHAAVVRLLLFELGADAGIRNQDQQTAFDVAAEYDRDGVVAVFKEFAAKAKPGPGTAPVAGAAGAGAAAASASAGSSAAL